MNAVTLPYWRRTVSARLICIVVAMLPALAVQTLRLDAGLPLRVLVLGAVAVFVALLLRAFESDVQPRHLISSTSLDALTQAALLAALWPSALALWPAAVALILAWIMQRLLGGSSVNPFPPVVLALALAIVLLLSLTGAGFAPPLLSLIDTSLVALVWLGMGLVLIALRLRPLRSPLAFLAALIPALAMGGISSTGFVVAGLVTSFVLADTRYLPANPKGQYVSGALAGLSTAGLWMMGAPPLSLAFPLLLVFALTPWIEQRSMPRMSERRSSV